MGNFGVIGEFMRTLSEPVAFVDSELAIEVSTEYGAMRISTTSDARPIAYQSLWGDGEAWTSAVAFCLPSMPKKNSVGLHRIGYDSQALRAKDVHSVLFDLGVGVGHTTMCIRTCDAEILAMARELEGEDVLGAGGAELLKVLRAKSPVRVMISPMGRIEVYSPIPVEGGRSPSGPHTHLLSALAALRRTHAANIPIADSLQPVLTLHPRSPWRSADGGRCGYDRTAADEFDELFAEFGDHRAREVSRSIEFAVLSSLPPHIFAFPTERHLRTQARVALRRLAQEGKGPNMGEWLAMYD